MHMAELFYILQAQNDVHNRPQKAGMDAADFDRLKGMLDEDAG